MKPTTRKTAIVTGASTGIGKATAAALVKAGYTVFGSSRSPATSALNGVTMLPLDVTSDASVADRAESPSDPVAEEEQDDADYGSLLSLRNPFQAPREEFVRIEEPTPSSGDVEPAVVFPAATRSFDPPSAVREPAPVAAASPAEADEALRRALATLQRMSRGG